MGSIGGDVYCRPLLGTTAGLLFPAKTSIHTTLRLHRSTCTRIVLSSPTAAHDWSPALRRWLLLFLVCCWTGAVSAQTIGTVTCPSGAGNVFNVPADGSLNTLYNTHGDGKTYNIAADTYTLSATIGPISSGTTCFVGVGSGQVTLTFTTGRHFQSDTTGTSLGLKGLTLRGGAGTGSGNSGGVTANQPEAVGVEDVVFDRCQSDFGGGLYVEADASVTESVVISNSAFVGNKAAGGSGGGLFLNSGDTAPTHQVTLSQVGAAGL